jgi:site-specific recombinase XerD
MDGEDEAMFETIIQDYLQHLKLERGLSTNSVQSYRCDLEEFKSFTTLKSPAMVSTAEFTRYVRHLSELSRKPATIARKISSLKQFFRYLYDKGLVRINPVVSFSIIRSIFRSARLPVLSRPLTPLLRSVSVTGP